MRPTLRRPSPLALACLSTLALTSPAAHAAPPTSPAAPPTSPAPMTSPADVEADVRAWREKRIASLTSDDGWLTLVGLHWLKEGANHFGSAPDNDLVFPTQAPPHAGTFTLQGGAVRFAAEPGASVLKGDQPFTSGAVRTDADGAPDVLRLGSLHFHVIKRGDRFGIRVKDPDSEVRKHFHGIPTYPVNAAWRFEARFEPTATPRTLAVPNVLGMVEEMPSPGTAVFTVNGKEYRLDPVIEQGEDKLFFIFADETNRTDTYGAGRFLYAAMPKNGKVVLDFNKAYNPPCSFTAYATCPLPPPQNRLKLRVEAGEKRYGNH